LRDRHEDIPALSRYFLSDVTKTVNFSRVLNDDALVELSKYSWPGNIRQLRNIIERLAAASANEVINGDDVRATLNEIKETQPKPDELLSIAEVEKRHIAHVLEYCRQNISKTAKILDIDPKTLRSKIANYKLLPK
jgi:DNA-binding NtrC family response regulator